MNRRHRRIAVGIALVSLASWLLLAMNETAPILLQFCGIDAWRGWDEAMLMLRVNGPGPVLGSHALMIAAMMAPMLGEPLRHISDRSLACSRRSSMARFCLGYVAIWLCVMPALWLAGMILSMNLGGPLLIAGIGALVWQMTPWRQSLLNRCHVRPPVSGRGCLGYGLRTGLYCAAVCGPLMLAAMVGGAWHLPVMLIASLFLWIERRLPPERPLWGPAALRRTARRQAYWLGQLARRWAARLGAPAHG